MIRGRVIPTNVKHHYNFGMYNAGKMAVFIDFCTDTNTHIFGYTLILIGAYGLYLDQLEFMTVLDLNSNSELKIVGIDDI